MSEYQVKQNSITIGEGVSFTGSINAPGTATVNGVVSLLAFCTFLIDKLLRVSGH